MQIKPFLDLMKRAQKSKYINFVMHSRMIMQCYDVSQDSDIGTHYILHNIHFYLVSFICTYYLNRKQNEECFYFLPSSIQYDHRPCPLGTYFQSKGCRRSGIFCRLQPRENGRQFIYCFRTFSCRFSLGRCAL